MATQIKNGAAGIVNEAYVSTGNLLLSDNLMWGKTFLRQDERDFLTFMESQANWAVSDGSTIRWHELSWITNNAKVGSIVSGGATPGAAMVIQIAAADHYVSGTRSPFTENLTLKINSYDLFIQIKDETTPYAHTITVIAPVGSSAAAVALNTVIVANQTMVPVGDGYAENTDFNVGEPSLPTEFEESLGISKASILVTATQGTNAMKELGAYGGTRYVTHDADKECFIKHKLRLSFQMLIGSGGTTVDKNGKTVRLIRGIESQIKTRGNTYGYNQSLTLGDIYNWTRLLLNERAPMENLMKVGHEANIGLEGVMTEAMKQGAKIYMDNSKPGVDSKLIDFGFDAVQVAGFMFYKQPFVEFNHPMVTGAVGQAYPHKIMITPHKMVKDPVSGQSGYTMKIGYKKADGPNGVRFDRKFHFSMLGNSAPTPTNGMDNVTFNYVTEAGPAIACANQAIIVERNDI